MYEIVQAWVKDSPNIVPIAQMETRSIILAEETARLWKRLGWRVERLVREDSVLQS